MTETGSTVERLREQVGPEKFNCFLPVYIEDIRALLAVVEAAQDVAKYEPDASLSPGVAQDMPRLRAALDRLHSQASDEGKPR